MKPHHVYVGPEQLPAYERALEAHDFLSGDPGPMWVTRERWNDFCAPSPADADRIARRDRSADLPSIALNGFAAMSATVEQDLQRREHVIARLKEMVLCLLEAPEQAGSVRGFLASTRAEYPDVLDGEREGRVVKTDSNHGDLVASLEGIDKATFTTPSPLGVEVFLLPPPWADAKDGQERDSAPDQAPQGAEMTGGVERATGLEPPAPSTPASTPSTRHGGASINSTEGPGEGPGGTE